VSRLVARSELPFPVEDVFAWHARPGALERLTPPWEPTEVLAREGTIRDGDRALLRLRAGRWEAVHRDFVDGRQFVDEQVRGPFRRWVHTHRFAPAPSGCTVEDDVEYALPLGALGQAAAGRAVERRLARLFQYRHAQLRADLARHAEARALGARPLRVAVSGASGLVGRALCAFLSTGGHAVARLVRRPARAADEIEWDPARGTIDAARLRDVDAVVHLAGESVGARWTAARKRAVRESRVAGTRLIAEALAPPRVLVTASAVGYYGDRGDAPLDEEAGSGEGFLAGVCRDWEEAAAPAERAGVRVVRARIGVVLTPSGGALARLLPPFRAGLGGPVGSGRQVMSWVALDDLVAALHCALVDERLRGAVNVTAPAPVSQAELARALGRALGRPSVLPLPAAAVRALFGEMGREMLLWGQRVLPRRLEAVGFRFRYPALDAALPTLLGATVEQACQLSFTR
jgi:uncharacterized protein (TIGR01777 family)